jgi:hypothetical protein
MLRFSPRGSDDERDDGIWSCGRRHVAGLLPADDVFAKPPRKSPIGATTARPTAAIIPGEMARASSVGSAAKLPHSTAQAIRVIQAEAKAEETATAIDDSRLRTTSRILDLPHEKF